MITNFKNNEVHQVCPNCNNGNIVDISERVLNFIEEFNEYENLSITCECGITEVFNMNLPLEESDEIMESDLQRANIKAIMKYLRNDL